MIEMLGVLAIVGVLSAGGIAGYSMAMQSYKTNQLIDRIQLIATRVRTVYKNGNYTGVSKTNLIKSGKLSENDFKNPFGGDDFEPCGGCGGPNTFTILAYGIPADTCVDILTMDWGGLVSSFWDHSAELGVPLGLSVESAAERCKNNSVGIEIIFK